MRNFPLQLLGSASAFLGNLYLQKTLMISGETYSSYIQGELFKYLGRLSMPMFIFHWGIGSLVNIVTDNLKLRFWLYYIGTLLIAMLAIVITRFIRRNEFRTGNKRTA